MIFCKDCRHLVGRKCHNPKFGHYASDPVTAATLRNEHGKCYLGVEFQPKFTFKEKFMARFNW